MLAGLTAKSKGWALVLWNEHAPLPRLPNLLGRSPEDVVVAAAGLAGAGSLTQDLRRRLPGTGSLAQAFRCGISVEGLPILSYTFTFAGAAGRDIG